MCGGRVVRPPQYPPGTCMFYKVVIDRVARVVEAVHFYPLPIKWGRGFVITMYSRVSAFRFQMISRKPLAGVFSYYIHTSLRGEGGVDVPFGHDL